MSTTSKSKKVTKGFKSAFCSLATGPTTEALAEKVQRAAISQLRVQISSQEGQTIKFEDALENAMEERKNALYNNGKAIDVDKPNYVQNLINAEQAVNSAKNALEQHAFNLDFLRKCLAEVEGTSVEEA